MGIRSSQFERFLCLPYPSLEVLLDADAGTGGTGHDNIEITDSAAEIAVLQAKVEAAAELHQVLRDQIADLKADRDGWRQQAENAARLLTPPKRRWWEAKAAG